jgi:hypothetical protein
VKTHAGKPAPAKNTTRASRPDASATRQHRPGDNSPAKAGASKVESKNGIKAEGDAKRAAHHHEEARSRAAMAAELARQGQEEGASGQPGRDAASPHGGGGDYLSSD